MIKNLTEFDNEVVPNCLAVTRTDAELAAFDHENGDPFVASIDVDLSSFDNKPGGHSCTRTGVILDDGPLFDDEHEHEEAELIPYRYVIIGSYIATPATTIDEPSTFF
jgi:hypothetical protein